MLGGGYGADDGIFRYKRSFAPHGLVPFFVGRRVLAAGAVPGAHASGPARAAIPTSFPRIGQDPSNGAPRDSVRGPGFHTSIQPLPAPLRAELNGTYWHAGCPVPLSGLRLLTVTHWGFDGRAHDADSSS